MNRTRSARTRVLLAGLALAAIACGSAAAAMPRLSFRLHARLAPVAGTAANGDFNGTLATSVGGTRLTGVVPRRGYHWRLAWQLRVPALRGPAVASVRIRATKSAPAVTRVLCTRCSSTAAGTLAVKGSQAIRIAKGDAVIVVRMPSARLRGAVDATAQRPRASRR